MNVPPELQDAESFLEEFRACTWGDVVWSRYYKNTDFIEQSGITKEEINDIILVRLNKSHRKKGPEEERDSTHPDGIIYVFEYPWESKTLYIKLKIMIKGTQRMTLCMSFHESTRY